MEAILGLLLVCVLVGANILVRGRFNHPWMRVRLRRRRR